MHTAALIDCLCVKLVCSCIHKLVSIETFLTGDVFSQLSLPITGGQEKMCLGRRLRGGGSQVHFNKQTGFIFALDFLVLR